MKEIATFAIGLLAIPFAAFLCLLFLVTGIVASVFALGQTVMEIWEGAK